MKDIFNYPIALYLVAGFASLCIMIIIDFLLGAEAEHLNAWVIVNRLFSRNIGIGDSLAIKQFGLIGAIFIMVAVNMVFGAILMQLLRLVIFLVHS